MSWQEELFNSEDYFIFYKDLLVNEERAEREAKFIVELLDLPKGSRILDVPCGVGRHSVRMANAGYEVVGVDFSEFQLKKARELAEKFGSNVNLIQGDMRDLPFNSEFDAVVNFFTSFGYFSDEENKKVLVEIAKALKPNGKLLLDLVNREHLINKTDFSAEWIGKQDYEGGLVMMEKGEFNFLTGRNVTKRLLLDKEGTKHRAYEIDLRLYSLVEMKYLLEEAGFSIKEFFGSTNRDAYSAESSRLIILAVKNS